MYLSKKCNIDTFQNTFKKKELKGSLYETQVNVDI